MKSIMFQGTASSVGKSLIAAAFCRIFKEDGYRVVPFKSQNMALNSFITEEGLEMGRAQVVQAEAAGLKPSVLMNPILLKPTSDKKSQVIIKGKVYSNMTAVEYYQFKHRLVKVVEEVYKELTKDFDIVVLEGAGSPAEINLKDEDIVNMGMAEIADSPVILVGDIDRGGVFAALVGTIMLLEEEERQRVKGVIINKFRGDIKILEPGLRKLEEMIKIPILGVVPYCDIKIDDEDSLTERFRKKENREGCIKVEVVKLPHISNFTDFNVFETQPDVWFRYINPGEVPDNPDLLIIPGSKNTIEDMKYLRESGLQKEIQKVHKDGKYVMGICGGYQILGREIRDPDNIESYIGYIEGLGLLNTTTTIAAQKVTRQVEGSVCKNIGLFSGLEDYGVKGYEIHMGETRLMEGVEPLIRIKTLGGCFHNNLDGAVNKDGNVAGTYIHGVFDNVHITRGILNNIRKQKSLLPLQSEIASFGEFKEEQYQKLARIVRENVDIDKIYRIIGAGSCD